MQKSRTEIKSIVKGYSINGLAEAAYAVEWVFYINSVTVHYFGCFITAVK